MSSRVIIPEIVGEDPRSRPGSRPEDSRRLTAPLPGWGSMLRALLAGLFLVVGVGSALFLGGLLFIVFAVIFALASLIAALGGRSRARSRTVVVRSTGDGTTVVRETLLIDPGLHDDKRREPRS
jgi:hypothetical protein